MRNTAAAAGKRSAGKRAAASKQAAASKRAGKRASANSPQSRTTRAKHGEALVVYDAARNATVPLAPVPYTIEADGSINGVGRPRKRQCFPSSHVMPVRCFHCGRVVAGRLLADFERFLADGDSEHAAMHRLRTRAGQPLPFHCLNMFKSHGDMTVMRLQPGQVFM